MNRKIAEKLFSSPIYGVGCSTFLNELLLEAESSSRPLSTGWGVLLEYLDEQIADLESSRPLSTGWGVLQFAKMLYDYFMEVLVPYLRGGVFYSLIALYGKRAEACSRPLSTGWGVLLRATWIQNKLIKSSRPLSTGWGVLQG